MKRPIYLLALLLAAGVIPASLHAQDSTPDPQAGRITFVSDRDGNPELYFMAADGSELTRLTYTPRADGDAAWSPDGTTLVFTTETASGTELVALDVVSGAAKQLTSLGAMISHPVWSPNGNFIAFAANPDGNYELYTITPDGLDPANQTNNPANDTWPSWSPDGTQLAFESDRDGNSEIYMLDLASDRVTRLTDSPSPDRNPVWSPADNRITFISERNGNVDIFAIDLDTQDLIQLSDTPFDDTSPVWSPDGTMIAFIGSPQENITEIFTIDLDASNARQRTTDGLKVSDPSWSPDGEWITYASNRGGGFDIYALHAGGEGWIALTDMPASNETRPMWTSFTASTALLSTPTPTPAPTLSPTPTTPAAPTPTPVPDLLLVYNTALPSFELINVSGRSLNLTGLRFEGNSQVVYSSIWEESNPSLILAAFERNACLGLWALEVPEQPVPAECRTRLAWWASDNTIFWTGGTFTVMYYDAPVAVCKSNDGRCPINLGASDETDSSPEVIPTQPTGSGDVLLTYDPAIPSFYLTNTSARLLNLAPLSFTGNNVTVNASIWREAGMSSDLRQFDSRGCLGLWGLSIEQAPVPLECRFRHGWWTSDEIIFWTDDTFTVRYADSPLAICDVNDGHCLFNIPGG